MKKRFSRKMRKMLLMVASLALVLGLAIGGTIAWLVDTTAPVVNTFSPSDISITLTETNPSTIVDGKHSAKMVPGCDITKDPLVTVKANSEACWLFVKIDKSANYGKYLEEYTVADEWEKLEDGIYYREVPAAAADQPFYVLGAKDGFKNGFVTVKSGVTVADMEKITNGTEAQPTLTFTAYAIQREKFDTAADAWAELNPSTGA